MKSTHFLLIVGALCATMFSACKKYEDGPSLSLRTKKARVVNEWKYEKVIDPSDNDITASYTNVFVEFTKDDNFIQTGGTTIYDSGTWQFASDKETIVISTPSNNLRWDILRLKNKELWVVWKSNYGDYEFHFVPR